MERTGTSLIPAMFSYWCTDDASAIADSNQITQLIGAWRLGGPSLREVPVIPSAHFPSFLPFFLRWWHTSHCSCGSSHLPSSSLSQPMRTSCRPRLLRSGDHCCRVSGERLSNTVWSVWSWKRFCQKFLLCSAGLAATAAALRNIPMGTVTHLHFHDHASELAFPLHCAPDSAWPDDFGAALVDVVTLKINAIKS